MDAYIFISVPHFNFRIDISKSIKNFFKCFWEYNSSRRTYFSHIIFFLIETPKTWWLLSQFLMELYEFLYNIISFFNHFAYKYIKIKI